VAARHAVEIHPAEPGGRQDVPLAVTGRYLPALDGLRGLAMVAVLLYHLDFSWASGFYLSIDLFFVLSGFLITSLLLEEWALKGRLSLGGFYARRARRLLPALFLALTLIALYVVLDGRFGPPGSTALIDLSGLRGDALATLFYVANWHAIFANESYWAQYAAQSPLKHTWTLAIEEQFYLVWPPLLLGLLVVARKFGRHWRRLGLGVALVGTLASAIAMSVLFRASDPSRVYYGTDTRAFDLFAGIAVAMVAAARPQPGPRARRALHVLGPLAAVVLAAFWALSAQPGTGGQARTWMYHGGFVVCAGLAGLVVADVRQVHRGPLGRALSFRPLIWLGMISYGLYLFHWPVIIFLNAQRTGLSGLALTAARIGVTLALATASFYLVEKPVRRAKLTGWRRVALGPVAAIATAVIIVVATLPAVAAPGGVVASAGAAETTDVPGAGGFSHQVPITLPPGRPITAAHPLRVMLIGDSVMYVAAPGIARALQATHRAVVTDRAFVGFGLSRVPSWPTLFPQDVAQVHPQIIMATWSWDDSWALDHPKNYEATLDRFIRLLLSPGNGVAGVIFVQFPPSGPFFSFLPDAAQDTRYRQREQAAWDAVVRKLPAAFPGKVMYLPVAPSILLDGHFSQWLPPVGRPHAPRSQWVRVRMIDRVHLCPPGVVRYSSAVLSDMQRLFDLPAARGAWYAGSWTSDPRYNDPPGTCPDDHPPG
jgi:peptidoglycan/LPS O-acetylase OafA/YrhL